MPIHFCHARGCKVAVPPRLLMCSSHWKMVPRAVQRAVYLHYQAGQERGLYSPTPSWLRAADDAIKHVAKIEAALQSEQAAKTAQGELEL